MWLGNTGKIEPTKYKTRKNNKYVVLINGAKSATSRLQVHQTCKLTHHFVPHNKKGKFDENGLS
jgi:hypothetical protein